MLEFDQTFITLSERWMLFRLQFKKQASEEYFGTSLGQLCEYRLIARNYKAELTQSGASIPDGTYSLTNTYKRYKLYCHERFFTRKLPTVLSILALIGAYRGEILSILQALKLLLKNIMPI